MGLSLDLPKDKNQLYYDYINAYWAIDQVIYTTEIIDFRLVAYPTREAKLRNYSTLENPSISNSKGDRFGSANGAGTVSCDLYTWHVALPITEIFSDGVIPAGKDAQYTAIYNWIKEYTQLPFEDVFEDEQEASD